MKNNKILIITVLTAIILCSLLSGCDDSYDQTSTNVFKYAVIESGEYCIIHEIDWEYSDYGLIRMKTECCGNVIKTNNVVLYKEIPNLNGITKCGEME